MTEEFFNFKLKKTLYDGYEDGFYKFSAKISIPNIVKEFFFENISAKPIWDVECNLKKNIIERINGIKTILHKSDPEPSYKFNNLDIYIQNSANDEGDVTLVFATGESQPARYKIILLGAVLKK